MQGRLVFGLVGLFIGLAAGFFAANSLNRQNMVAAPATSANALPGTGDNVASSGPGGMQVDVAQTLQAAESDPNNFVAQMRAGDMYAQIGRFDKAIEFYSRGVSLNPQNAPAHIVLANAYFDTQKFEEAEAHYTKALEIEPKDVNARTDLGATFVERPNPDYDRAILEFGKALESDPKSAPTLYYLGVAHLRKGDRAQAQQTLAELEKVDSRGELITRLRQNIENNAATR